MPSGSGIATALNFAPIVKQRSYWATHFVSLLECLRFHNTLQWPGSKMSAIGKERWSLSDLRAEAPANFFSLIYQQVNNWGFQYFLVTMLNSPESKPIVEALISEIDRLFGSNFDIVSDTYHFRISGRDSNLSKGLDGYITDIFPYVDPMDFVKSRSIMDNSDLCLTIDSDNFGGLKTKKYGVFGEVEGLHGDFLSRNGYWKNKSEYCIYAFGVVKEKGGKVFLSTREIAGVERILITFQADHFVVNDFLTALWWINNIFQNGASANLPPNIGEEEAHFLNMIRSNFNADLDDLIELMSAHISSKDVIIINPGLSKLIPNIRS